MTILDQSFKPSAAAFGRARPTGRARELSVGLPRLVLHAFARGVALFFGLFALLNLVGAVRHPGLDENIWWLDLRPLPTSLSALLLGLAGVLLVWWAARPAAPLWRRLVTAAVVVALAAVAIRNGVEFYRAWHAGLIRPRVGVPLSFVLATLLLALAWMAVAAPPARGRRRQRLDEALVVLVALGVCGILFPVAQGFFFGKTAYTRPAEVAVVFGAQVHQDGRPSISLVDRVRTAAQLYHEGSARRLLVSGAKGSDEPSNETAVMRLLAIDFGVPAGAITVDPSGYNTAATVHDTVPMLRELGYRSVAVVTDFYHLPRVKMAYQRAGYEVITVPSRARRIPQTTGLVLREVPAFWVYYLRGIL